MIHVLDVPHGLGAGVGELVRHRRHEERSGGAEATRRRRPLPFLGFAMRRRLS